MFLFISILFSFFNVLFISFPQNKQNNQIPDNSTFLQLKKRKKEKKKKKKKFGKKIFFFNLFFSSFSFKEETNEKNSQILLSNWKILKKFSERL